MNDTKFAALVHELAPKHGQAAIPAWIKFAAECVECEQFVHFKSTGDKEADKGKWLDALYAGFCAVRESYGQEAAAALIDLGCEPCCLYPGEMMQAAVCLERGMDGNGIMELIEYGDIDASDLFAPLSKEEAEKNMASVFAEQHKAERDEGAEQGRNK